MRTALAGSEAGEVFEGDRRFDIVVRLPETVRNDMPALERSADPACQAERALAAPGALPAAHAAIARPSSCRSARSPRSGSTEGPNQVSRENGKRRVVVQANVRGRDIGSFVAEAQRAIAGDGAAAAGYWLDWGGQFENMIAARDAARDRRAAGAAADLRAAVRRVRLGARMRCSCSAACRSRSPAACSRWRLRGMPFSITAGVGFIALSGVAVLNGVVMLSFIRKLREAGRRSTRP